MTNFIVIFISLIAGIVLRRSSRFPENSASAFNAFVIYVAYPAVILAQFPVLLDHTPLDRGVVVPISMSWILFLASWLTFSNLGKRLGWSRATTGALVLTAGLGNTSFVGFPLLEALLGPEAVRIGILNDQPGSFLTLSTLGLAVAAIYSGAKPSVSSITRRILTFPPFLALVFATLWWIIGTPGADQLRPSLERIGSTLVPVALFAVGLQMRWKFLEIRALRAELALGLGFKLVIAPALFAFLYFKILPHPDFTTRVTVLESAMAPMITSAIVATEFGLDSQLANLMLGIGIPISLFSVPLLNWLL
jgi:predicted permease